MDEEKNESVFMEQWGSSLIRKPFSRYLLSRGLSKRETVLRRENIGGWMGLALGAGNIIGGIGICSLIGWSFYLIPAIMAIAAVGGIASGMMKQGKQRRIKGQREMPARVARREETLAARARAIAGIDFNSVALQAPIETATHVPLKPKTRGLKR